MMGKEVKPTRSELLELKKKIRLSEAGHKLLKMKRDGLIIEFFNVLAKARGIRKRLIEKYKIGEEKIAIARAVEGVIGVKSASFALKEEPEISLKTKNVMGVEVPLIKARKIRKNMLERGYGIIGMSQRIDDVAKAYEELVEDIILAAETETTLRKV
ncbi:MAG: V-type ATP synthase subunit D, partial [Candidatus Thermoplasmatota archaeon]